MIDFDQLVRSRREWIDNVLIPWCRSASFKDLRRAEREWQDIAGRVDPQSSLWMWAWGRFPGLVVEGLPGFDETYPVTVRLKNGEVVSGYPDARQSRGGTLVLLEEASGETRGPFGIDDVVSLERSSGDH